MSNFNTAWRSLCTLGVVCLLSATAWGQSALNFTPDRVPGVGIAVTNTTAYPADVKFTLFSPDGSVDTDVLNNTSFRIPPRGQIAVSAEEVFRPKPGFSGRGWIQVSSSVTGLQGVYFAGNYPNTFDGGQSLSPAPVQTIPFLRSGANVATDVVVTNPASQTTDVVVGFFNTTGALVQQESFSLSAHAQRILPARGANAHITGSSALLVTALEKTSNSLVSIDGQAMESQPLRLVAPGFRNEGTTRSTLALANPLPTQVQVKISYFNDQGLVEFTPKIVELQGNGSTTVDWSTIVTSPAFTGTGWLLVESATPAPLTGVVLIDSGTARTAVPLQSRGMDRMLFSRALESGDLTSLMTLVGGDRDAQVTIALSRTDGTEVATNTLSLPALAIRSGKLSDLVPMAAPFGVGFVAIRSSAPIFAAELMNFPGGSATITPQPLPSTYASVPVAATPQIQVTWTGNLGPGTTITIDAQNHFGELALTVGGQVVPLTPAAAPSGRFTAVLPQQLEPGIVEVTLWSGWLKSNTVQLGIYSPDGVLTAASPSLEGQAFYAKAELTDNGLDESQVSKVPIRNARVEIWDRLAQSLVSVTGTDDSGKFATRVPAGRSLTVRIVSSLRSQRLKVVDNTNADTPYVISKDIDSLENVEIVDTTRVSGAFNILDVIQRANVVVGGVESSRLLPPLTLYWSTKNTGRTGDVHAGDIGTTFFDLATNSAYILGDRITDSDEFDDSVIVHEYAHWLAARFSRDDSPGRTHGIGDVLDPRVAWSEGFANFFSAVVLGNPVYRDSKGPIGALGLRMDLEADIPVGDHPGYWSEASVQGLLWDLVDENADNADTAQFPFPAIWAAFTELKKARPAYLPYFLETFADQNASFADALRTMAIARSINFQPLTRPSVSDPFPRPIAIGEQVFDEIDSFTTKRTNLMESAHLYSLTIAAGAQFTIRLNVEGLGKGNNVSANDLDLFLFDRQDRLLKQSDTGLSGQSEIIPATYLDPGTYLVEVRSFYRQAETNSFVFNSGRYRLSVQKN